MITYTLVHIHVHVLYIYYRISQSIYKFVLSLQLIFKREQGTGYMYIV